MKLILDYIICLFGTTLKKKSFKIFHKTPRLQIHFLNLGIQFLKKYVHSLINESKSTKILPLFYRLRDL